MIVFGWNSFTLTSFKPSSIGLPVEMDATITIERIQKYSHLFWIPFYPLEQEWIIRKKGDSASYEPTQELKAYLNALLLKYKIPWYSFALPILAVVIGVIVFSASQISSYQSKKEYQAYLIENNQKLQVLVHEGKPNTYFILHDKNYKKIYVKVIGSDATSLNCVLSQANNCNNYSNCLLEAFIFDNSTNEIPLDTIIVLKKDLLDAYNSKDIYPFEPKKIASNYGGMTLDEFKIIDYPVFEFGMASYKEKIYISSLKNIGAPVKDVLFKSDQEDYNTLSLNTSLMPSVLKNGDALILSGTYKNVDPLFVGHIVFTKENNMTDSCKVIINGVKISITNKNDK